MPFELKIALLKLLGWLILPLVGTAVGFINGFILRATGRKIDTNATKPNPIEISAAVGLVLGALFIVGVELLFPSGGITMDFVLQLAVGSLLYVILAEGIAIEIANRHPKKLA